jgi:hypothetical protein
MQNKLLKMQLLMIICGVLVTSSCVNPPEKGSSTMPRITPPPQESPQATQTPMDDVRGREISAPATGTTVPAPTGTTPATAPASGTTPYKINYWLSKTDNSNCLTIQPVGAASISPKCSLDGAQLGVWLSQEVPATATGSLSATIKVETSDKLTAKKFVSASDNVGEYAWRWRCVKTKDQKAQITVHTVCYEDGNAVNKVYDSSDLFVQFIGPEKVELTGVQCVPGADVDMTKCMPK